MKQYHEYLNYILQNGTEKRDRTNTGIISVFGGQMRFDLTQGFPLVTTKKIHIPAVVHELLWFLSGDTNIKYLKENNVRIWNEWADENGNLGPVYGKQWRYWQTSRGETIDQISTIIEQIKHDPDSRRIILTAWNVGELAEMALPPCHLLCQFYVNQGHLSCQLYQRSGDSFLGVPFNIASYSLLTHLIAHQCDLKAGEFIWTGGDCHIYLNHLEQVHTQLSRTFFPLPTLHLKRKPNSIFEYCYDDIEFLNYQFHPAIQGQVAV